MPRPGIRCNGEWTLTGRNRHRISLFRRVIVEVEEKCPTGIAAYGRINWTGEIYRWRKARVADLDLGIKS